MRNSGSHSTAAGSRRRWAISLGTSTGVHLLALVAVVVWAWTAGANSLTPQPAVRTDVPEDAAAPAVIAAPVGEVKTINAHNMAASNPSFLQEWIRREFDDARTQADAQPREEAFDQLDELGQRVQNLSTTERVADMSRWILGSVNVAPRQAPEAGLRDSRELEQASIQIEDVQQRTDAAGVVTYIAIVSDHSGRRAEVELTEAEGAEIYRLFQLMAKYPLLKEVYRSTALPLLNQLMAERDAELPAPQPETPPE